MNVTPKEAIAMVKALSIVVDNLPTPDAKVFNAQSQVMSALDDLEDEYRRLVAQARDADVMRDAARKRM